VLACRQHGNLTDHVQRISRRGVAEQHLALTETFHSPWHFPHAQPVHDAEAVGQIFLRCNARDIVEKCGKKTQELIRKAYGPHVSVPEIRINGHLEATFPYVLSHLEYIIGELLRNAMQAVIEQRQWKDTTPPPIEVLICETSHHVIIRISDQGGGIPTEVLPHLWSFSKGPHREKRMENLAQVPKLLGTDMQDVRVPVEPRKKHARHSEAFLHHGSLSSLTSRPPNLRLGIGLPMSRIYSGTTLPCQHDISFLSSSSNLSFQSTGLATSRSIAWKVLVSTPSCRFQN